MRKIKTKSTLSIVNYQLSIIIAAIIIFAASCGETAPKSNAETQEAISEEQFVELMEKIYYALPPSAMNEWLKTTEQRKAAKNEDIKAFPAHFRYIYFDNDYNSMRFDVNYGEAFHDGWKMIGFLTDDQQNMVLIIIADSGIDEVTGTLFDITLNYNIKTGKFTEIERPLEPFTTDELFSSIHINDTDIQKQAKTFIKNAPDAGVYYIFDKNGFFVELNLDMFWNGDDDVWKYYNENIQTIYSPDRKAPYYKWNGNRFEKTYLTIDN